MSNAELTERSLTDEEQRTRLRELLGRWGETKRALDVIDHEIAVLEFDMGYTAHIGGPLLMQRRK